MHMNGALQGWCSRTLYLYIPCALWTDGSSLNSTYAPLMIGVTMPSIRGIGYNIMMCWTFSLYILPLRLISSVLQILWLCMPLTTSWFHFKNGSTFCILTLIFTDPSKLHQFKAASPVIALLRRIGTISRNTLPCLVTPSLVLMLQHTWFMSIVVLKT